jgi:tetratricopeptide (TPR) repeat protein
MVEELDNNDKLYLGALLAIRDGKYGDAIPALTQLVEENPQDLDSLQLLAGCFAACGDDLQALMALKQAHKIDPMNCKILGLLGMTYYRLFLHPFAIETLNRVIKLGELNEDVFIHLADSYFLLEDNDQAIRVLKKGLKINPSWTRLLHKLGMLHLYLKDYSKASQIGQQLKSMEYPLADDFCRMIEEDSLERDQIKNLQSKERANKLLLDSEQLLKNGKHIEATRTLISALEEDSELAMAYTFLGKIFDDCGLIDEGLSLHERAIHIDPKLAPAYNNLGYALKVKGEYQEAIDAYQKALEIDPKMVEAHNSIGFLYDTLGEYEKGLGHFQKALEIEPKRLTTLMNMAHAYRGLGRMEESLQTYQKASEYYPNDFGDIL